MNSLLHDSTVSLNGFPNAHVSRHVASVTSRLESPYSPPRTAMADVKVSRVEVQSPPSSWTRSQEGQMFILMVWREGMIVSAGGERSSRVARQPQPLNLFGDSSPHERRLKIVLAMALFSGLIRSSKTDLRLARVPRSPRPRLLPRQPR